MKILVVDDEQIMLDSICHILAQEPDLQVETARTGREAIEKAELFRPELVMMDLKMPGINGLEALTEIRRLDSQAILVILSAYENFSYAQEAIRLNVYDYLVKPINKTRLLELINKVKSQLMKIRELRQEELALRERYKKLLPLIENEFMFELINGIDEAAIGEYQELLALNFGSGFFLAISYHDKTGAPIENVMELAYLQRQKIAEVTEEIKHVLPCLAGPLKTNPFAVFIPLSPELANNPNQKDIAAKILTHLRNLRSEADINIGIGRIYSWGAELRRSYQEAVQALNYPVSGQICHFDEIKQLTEENWETDFHREMQDILDAIRFGNDSKVKSLTQQVFSKYINLATQKDRFFFYLLEFLIAAYRIGRENSKQSNIYPSFEQVLSLFNENNDPIKICSEIADKLTALALAVKDGRSNQVKTIIRQAKAIIDQQYAEQLNLEDLSHSVGISPFYFSRLFREELGISFSEYLTRLRMEKAVILLAQGLSVKECCFSVGYNDPNYFSRIFRKYYEMTPSEYRDEQARLKGADAQK